jgi:Protein of unknown function (DUF1501)
MFFASQAARAGSDRQQGEPALSAPAADNPLAPRAPHFAARAKQVVFIHLVGAPPNLDLFDFKPELQRRDGEDCPASFLEGKRFAFTTGVPKLLGSPRKFAQHGEAGMWFSDALQQLPELADELCVVHSLHTEQFNHAPAQLFLLSGSPRSGRPSFGSWVTWGLGSENQNLPGFVALISGGTTLDAGKNAWGSGFLPSVFQGVQCRTAGDPVLYLADPPGMSRELRRESIDAINRLNQLQLDELGGPETATRIAQYELAFRMQMEVPVVMDIGRETAETHAAYGAQPGASSFANNCLLARRLVEAGVRFVQLFDWGWDYHGTNPAEDIRDGLTASCAAMERPVVALIRDLRQRGLLDSTLVILGGEFGRTPFREGRTAEGEILGRDHYPDCFTMLMAGGGVKRGLSYGSTDELGFGITENPVHIHDFQATVMHLLGLDHKRLTYRFQGRDYRLTDVHGEIVEALLA